jgi:hypothetical protein
MVMVLNKSLVQLYHHFHIFKRQTIKNSEKCHFFEAIRDKQLRTKESVTIFIIKNHNG